MKLSDVTQHQGVRWGALVALLVGMTQFNTGLKLVYSKWTADEVAAEAKKTAADAKEKANGVDERFDQYIQQQKQAIETQNKVAEAIANYASHQQQQVPNASQRTAPSVWFERDENGRFYCADGTEQWWPDDDGRCE